MNLDLFTLQRNTLQDPRTEHTSNGVLCIRINRITILEKLSEKDHEGLGVTIKCQEKLKHFAMHEFSDLEWKESLLLGISIPTNTRHPFNELVFEFHLFGKTKKIWSTITFHLHDIVKASPVSTNLDIWGPFGRIGILQAELTFSYGAFGYGNSPYNSKYGKPSAIYSLFPDFQMQSLDQYEYPDYVPSIQISDVQREGKQSYIPDDSADLNEDLKSYFGESKRILRLLNLKKQLESPVTQKSFLRKNEQKVESLKLAHVKRNK
eukprot:NODE_321_length_9805_cov_0.700185.p6 type:complete len:264 gc:universal NODE_321_length_9805_cov_0.700185:2003-2794(+)